MKNVVNAINESFTNRYGSVNSKKPAKKSIKNESLEEGLDPNMVDILLIIQKGLDLAERYVLISNQNLSGKDDQKVVERSKEYLDHLRNYLKNN